MSKKKNFKKDKKELEELEQELSELETEDQLEELEILKKENKKLNKKLEDMKMILANTQHQYMDLKTDFDMFHKRMEEESESRKEQIKLDFFKKTLPIFDDIFQGLGNTPSNIVEDKWYEGFSMIGKNIQKFLLSYNIHLIPTVGEILDENMHEAISVIPGKEKEKGKILQEIKKGYYIDTLDGKKVIIPAKVIISG